MALRSGLVLRIRFGAEQWEENNVTNGVGIGEQHGQTVNSDAFNRLLGALPWQSARM